MVWAASVLCRAEFPDLRLHDRSVRFLAQIARRPGASIPRGAASPASAKADYRFLENKRVDPEQLWSAIHHDAACGLVDVSEALVVHDTTALMFPTLAATKGLGTIKGSRREALLMHSSLALRPDGHVLGLLHNAVWARPPKTLGKAKCRKQLPIEAKESRKWLDGVREATELRDAHSSRTRLIHVMDREGDVYEVMAETAQGGDDAVIRCAQDRSVTLDGTRGRVRALMPGVPVLRHYAVDVPRTAGRRARKAKVAIRSATVTVHPPKRLKGYEPIELGVVWVHEPKPPEGAEPLEWWLWTTLPVRTVERALRVVRIYKRRWRVEDFHLVLKQGCRIERTQLKTAVRIQILVCLSSVVAVRILQLTHWARTEPEAPCTEVLGETQWRVLWAHHHRRRVPRNHGPPTMHEVVRMIGRLGGHLGRKCDGFPGVRSLWRGLRDLELLVEGFLVEI